MKFISKKYLRRTTTDPTPATTESSSSSMNTMRVDLADKDALPALRVLKDSPSMNRNVTSAIVNADSCVWYGQIKMDLHALVEVFQCLSELPRLHNVTVDLSHLHVPVSALTALLRRARNLRELHLINIHLVGPVGPLEAELQAHTRLTRVRFLRCRGGDTVRSFMTNLPNLKKLELRHTTVGSATWGGDDDDDGKESPWIHLGRSTQLQALTIQEIPDLKTDHVLTFATALAHQQSLGTSNLQELHITSANVAVDGQLCGPAVADLFIVHPCSSIKTLTLKFGGTWKTTGNTISALLRKNPKLTSLCVELANKDFTAQGLQILSALKSNFVLKRLKLCLDQDQELDGPLDNRFEDAIERVLLEHNHILQSLVVMDESRERYPLRPSIRHKLDLNASRLPQILHSSAARGAYSSSLPKEYLRAMIDSKDNLNAVFYCFVNQPNLLLDLSPTALTLLEANSSKDDSLSSSNTTATTQDSDDDSEDPTANWGSRRNSLLDGTNKPHRNPSSTKKRLMKMFK